MISRNLNTHLVIVTSIAIATLTSTFFSPAALAAMDVKLTGFIKAGVVGSDRAVQSYGYGNYVAPTASRPDNTFSTTASNTDGGLSFQTAQTRFGLVATVDETTKGALEFDFVDFTKSSPTVQQSPRVRIAKIEHRLNEQLLIQIGQDWDIFSPLNTFSYNYVGNTFQAGNAGFMRQQIILVRTSESFEQKAALGLFNANTGATLDDQERSSIPSLAYSAAFGAIPSRIGASIFYSRFIVRPTGDRIMTDAYGLNVFTEQKWGSFDLRAEAYIGQNLNNSNSMLTLASRSKSSAGDVREAGGWVSGRMPVSDLTNIFGSVGYASVLNTENMAAAALSAPNDQITGISSNLAAKLGADRKLTDKLSMFGEFSHFKTQFKGLDEGNSNMAEVGLFLFL